MFYVCVFAFSFAVFVLIEKSKQPKLDNTSEFLRGDDAQDLELKE